MNLPTEAQHEGGVCEPSAEQPVLCHSNREAGAPLGQRPSLGRPRRAQPKASTAGRRETLCTRGTFGLFALVLAPLVSGWLSGCVGEFRTCHDVECSTFGGENGGTQSFGGAPPVGSGGVSGSAAGGSGGTEPSTLGGAASAGGAEGGEGGSAGAPCDRSLAPSLDACVIAEDLGVFVSPKGNDSRADGSRKAPFASLARALDAAAQLDKSVYACADAGAFNEGVTLGSTQGGTRIFGGFACADWSYTGKRTEIKSPEPIALSVNDLTSLLIEDVNFEAADATLPGASSAGAWLKGAREVVLRRVDLRAGAGADGVSGVGTRTAAASGASGSAGANACSVESAPNPGGAEVRTECGGKPSESIGGVGGEGATNDSGAGNGGAGKPDQSTKPDGGVTYGTAGFGENEASWGCQVGKGLGAGQSGANGESQAAAIGGQGLGTLSADGYSSSNGADGLNGTPGQGGGGGGGAKAPSTCGDERPRTGASGGSGGGGGCGGRGGTGGGGGGGSFALVSLSSSITLDGVALVVKSGGRGGNGGFGQPGGRGGNAANGGDGSAGSHAACRGGDGGQGGNGGHGGGGGGGPSIAIAYKGFAPLQLKPSSISLPSLGALGGTDGSGAVDGPGAGSTGLVKASQSF